VDAGTTFTLTAHDVHLWVVLSDPKKDQDNVLIVNLTTLDGRKEKACVLKRGDHPWVRHDTCVNYGDSKVTTLAQLLAAKDGGALKVGEAVSSTLLKRMRDGALASERMPLDNADVLINQGLVDC
jgi:hypothetical protein